MRLVHFCFALTAFLLRCWIALKFCCQVVLFSTKCMDCVSINAWQISMVELVEIGQSVIDYSTVICIV